MIIVKPDPRLKIKSPAELGVAGCVVSIPVCAALARPGCVETEAASWCQQSVAGPGNQKLSRWRVRERQSSADTGAPADTWHAVTRAGEARERPSLGTSMEDMMSHHKPFPYLLGAMIGT